jgi:hypothetical protein
MTDTSGKKYSVHEIEAYYFGKWPDRYAGHYLYGRNGYEVNDYYMPKDFPCPVYTLDGGFLPPYQAEIEGVASVVHLNGWTILAFWDRTGDKRGKSSSAFVVRGFWDFTALHHITQTAFPTIWKRFHFSITDGLYNSGLNAVHGLSSLR